MYNMSKEIQLSSLSLEFCIDNDVRSAHHGHLDDAGAKDELYQVLVNNTILYTILDKNMQNIQYYIQILYLIKAIIGPSGLHAPSRN